MLLLRTVLLAALVIHMSACGGGSTSDPDGVNTSNSLPDEVTGFPALDAIPANNLLMSSCKSLVPIPPDSSIIGRVQYQRVPLTERGLDYNNVVDLPARGIVVQAVAVTDNSCSQTVIASALTNANGEYGLNVPANQSVCVEARAQLYRDASAGGAGWNIQVLDNTNDRAAYYLADHRVKATPDEQAVRNLLAGTGAEPGSADYSSARAAAPFAILDTLCEAINTLVAVDDDIELPALLLNWSENNNVVVGDIEDGEIGGAFYRQQQFIDNNNNVRAVSHEIFLLGDEDNNTDEYDPHVISHEFGHFITATQSRYDALGGEHIIGQRLDMRLAFEEGWADAFSAIALDGASSLLDRPNVYRDSLGNDQGRVFRFAIDRNNHSRAGWYSESSVFSTIYSVFDSHNDGIIDTVSMGFAPIYNVLTDSAYKNSEAVLSLYTFVNHLKRMNDNTVAIDTLLAGQDIEQVTDDYGSNEDVSNNDVAGKQDVAAIYYELSVDSSIAVCSNNQFGLANKLSINQYLRFNAVTNKRYRFEITPFNDSSGNGQALLEIYQRGSLISRARADQRGEPLSHAVRLSGQYVALLTDVSNADIDGINVGRRCFIVSVE